MEELHYIYIYIIHAQLYSSTLFPEHALEVDDAPHQKAIKYSHPYKTLIEQTTGLKTNNVQFPRVSVHFITTVAVSSRPKQRVGIIHTALQSGFETTSSKSVSDSEEPMYIYIYIYHVVDSF